eukprot:Seg2757.5 transcript_id=Seg2757.5/GoldUCD/mRNA.D3Y31 product="hypothetical protein" protein_id=Seg2757.5/GoldUCD/D3Y31
MACTRAVFIVAAKRTAFGTFGGKLKDTTATTMGYLASVAALEAGNVDPNLVDTVVFGNVIQVKSVYVPGINRKCCPIGSGNVMLPI